MFRHVALLRFSPESTDEQHQALADGLATLPAAIPAIKGYQFGPDAGDRADNWHFAIVADFDDAEGHRTYVEDPTHRRLIAELVHPIVVDRAAVQYEI